MRLPFGLDLTSFVAGALFVVLIGFLVFVVNVWWKDATAPFRPQVVPQTTKKTPWQVVVGGLGRFLQLVGVAMVVAAIALLLFGFGLADVQVLPLVGGVAVIIGSLMRAVA
jgi:hypothetical protein